VALEQLEMIAKALGVKPGDLIVPDEEAKTAGEPQAAKEAA